ncbi:MAG: hypothetical protein CFE24_09380 [Flavobacterium sp. BFFFF2]|nr:MAG: hypothetical protein CFE24_09380 [Flavobacterium sp. BFFFF2]
MKKLRSQLMGNKRINNELQMTIFNIIPSKLAVITWLVLYLNFCHGQPYHKSWNESNNAHLTAQSIGPNAAAKGIDPQIRSIFQDKRGNYWFGTNGAGVYFYDTKTLIHYTKEDGLADNQVINIQEDDLGNLWFESGTFSMSTFDGTKFTTYSDQVKITNGTETDWKSKNSDLWFYAGGGGFRYSESTLTYLPFAPASFNTPSNAPFSLSRYGVYCILKDTKGNVWFGTQAEGVCQFDGKKRTWFKEKGLAGPAVLGIFEDSKGNLWFGNNGAGLFKYDGENLTNFTEQNGLNNTDFIATGKPDIGTLARVYAINEDHNGNIWVGTVDAGVWKIDGNKWTHYTTENGLTSNAVNTIYKDKNSELWFGTDSNGICKFNGTTFTEWTIK